jgi:aspartate racemase
MNSALRVGVIGGLGPDATIDFMASVVAHTPAAQDQEHIRLLVDQNPSIPNRQEAILRNGRSPGPELAKVAAGLEAAGCDFVVMPCNAAHYYETEITAAIRIPFVSIICVSVESLPEAVTKVGVLATPATVQSNLYQSALRSQDKTCILHNADELDAIMKLIYAIKRGERDAYVADAMTMITKSLVDRGAESIIVACTEVPLVLDTSDINVPIISSTDELAIRTVKLARKELPLPT